MYQCTPSTTIIKKKSHWSCWVPMANSCNPSYFRREDHEASGLKSVQTNRLRNPILTIPNKKRAGGLDQVV
jgi:hypothetical protein